MPEDPPTPHHAAELGEVGARDVVEQHVEAFSEVGLVAEVVESGLRARRREQLVCDERHRHQQKSEPPSTFTFAPVM